MAKRILLYALLSLLGLILGCAPVISTELKAGADTSITFKEVQQNPDAYKGKIVLWGGRIIQTLPQENGTTLIEVLEWPLGLWDKPRQTVGFRGKFLLMVKEPLGFSKYKRGNRITIAGEIQGGMEGGKIKELTDSSYQYPVVLGKEMHVWRSPSYSYSSIPDYSSSLEYNPTLR